MARIEYNARYMCINMRNKNNNTSMTVIDFEKYEITKNPLTYGYRILYGKENPHVPISLYRLLFNIIDTQEEYMMERA